MNNSFINNINKWYLVTAIVMLVFGLICGVLASHAYIAKEVWPGFLRLRPMHVSAVLFWILIGASGVIYAALQTKFKQKVSTVLQVAQLLLWWFAIVGVFYAYFTNDFGGREYWEFNPVYALPIALLWLLFLINFIKVIKSYKRWPVYVWMWFTGIVFFMFTFLENYLWLIPYFRNNLITDITIQWKANGSLVGSWNQLIYGTSFFLMEKISGNKKFGYTKVAFAMYFLGLFNLMFNWGHHIYTLPTEGFVRWVAYAVSMTEWIFFIKIIKDWKKTVDGAKMHFHYFPFKFLIAAEFWVFMNMFLAILMSIPVVNLFTHGTHITVAHAMGTTIGINSMILLGGITYFVSGQLQANKTKPYLNTCFWIIQISLLVFWLALLVAGITKGLWQNNILHWEFNKLMLHLQPWFMVFSVSGSIMAIALCVLCVYLARQILKAPNF